MLKFMMILISMITTKLISIITTILKLLITMMTTLKRMLKRMLLQLMLLQLIQLVHASFLSLMVESIIMSVLVKVGQSHGAQPGENLVMLVGAIALKFVL